MKCAKCSSKEIAGILAEGGKTYPFCKICLDILDSFPLSTNVMHDFLSPDQMKSQVARNIFEARKLRAEGKSPWRNCEERNEDDA